MQHFYWHFIDTEPDKCTWRTEFIWYHHECSPNVHCITATIIYRCYILWPFKWHYHFCAHKLAQPEAIRQRSISCFFWPSKTFHSLLSDNKNDIKWINNFYSLKATDMTFCSGAFIGLSNNTLVTHLITTIHYRVSLRAGEQHFSYAHKFDLIIKNVNLPLISRHVINTKHKIRWFRF